jgi:hypothetical protein
MKKIYMFGILVLLLMFGIILSFDKVENKNLCEDYSNLDLVEMRVNNFGKQEILLEKQWIDRDEVLNSCKIE